MGILNIEPVSRSGMRFLFSFYGLSETGKTLTALLVASGLEPDPRKRMLLDTEGGERGRAYEAEIPGGYLYASLSPPYTPERYMRALSEIEKAGVTVLVTDSASHAWFAEGGVLEMVEESANKNEMAKWKDPKRRLGKMMQRYRSSDMHHILCSRAKIPKIETYVDGKKTYVDGPVVPIQEKMMRYDMTIVAQMLGRGAYTLEAPQGKCPDNLLSIFQDTPLMSEHTGRKLAEWINVRHSLSPEARALKLQAAEVAENGADAFRGFWRKLNRDERAVLQSGLDNYQSIAASADDERNRRDAEIAEQDRADRERSDPNLDDPFGARPIAPVGETTQQPPAHDAQEREGGGSFSGPAAGPPLAPTVPPRDLLGHTPHQSLYVPVPKLRAKPEHYDFYARQIEALIDEGHGSAAILRDNPGVLDLLREPAPAHFEAISARLAE